MIIIILSKKSENQRFSQEIQNFEAVTRRSKNNVNSTFIKSKILEESSLESSLGSLSQNQEKEMNETKSEYIQRPNKEKFKQK